MKIRNLCSIVLSAATMATGVVAHAQADPNQDKKFIMTAAESDMAEIKLSQLALQKSSNAEVKAFAEKMVADHNKLEADMKPFADKMAVPPVVELKPEHQAKYDMLSGLSGTAFDKEYMKTMDIDHHKALMAFDAEIGTTTMSADSDFITTVTAGEKVVAMHTKMADKMLKTMGLPEYDPTSL